MNDDVLTEEVREVRARVNALQANEPGVWRRLAHLERDTQHLRWGLTLLAAAVAFLLATVVSR